MSSSSGSVAENGDDDVQNTFECVLCPGSSFTEAEKDLHRTFHKDQKAAARPGPASRRGRSTKAVPLPPGSLFVAKIQDLTPPLPGTSAGRRSAPPRTPKRKDKPSRSEGSPKSKRKSKKHYSKKDEKDTLAGVPYKGV